MEVAGLVISAIPICVLVLEGWLATESRVTKILGAPVAISRYARDLRAHQDILEVTIKTMLRGCMSLQEIESSFEDVLNKDWNHPDQAVISAKLRAKHGENFNTFQFSIRDICEDLRSIMVLMGILPDDAKLSMTHLGSVLDANHRPTRNAATFQARLRLAFKDRAIKMAFISLATGVERLTILLRSNEIWQEHRRHDQERSLSAVLQRRRAHLLALARAIEKTLQDSQSSRTLDFALLLDETIRSETDAPEALRYFAVFHNRVFWRKAIFHASDSVAAHDFNEKRTPTLAVIQDLWPHLQNPIDHPECLELHLDLRESQKLTGFFETPYRAQYGTAARDIHMLPARSLLGKPVSLPRRLHMAATIASWMELLYGTPLMQDAWDPDDIKCMSSDMASGVTLTEPLCLRTSFQSPVTPAPAASNTAQGTALLMLGIVLIELWTNKPCIALQDPTSRSMKGLDSILGDMMAAEGPDLPLEYSRAVGDCWRLARTPDAFQAEFGGLVHSVVQTADIFPVHASHRMT